MLKTKTIRFPLFLLIVATIVFLAMLMLRKNKDEDIYMSDPTWKCEYIKYSWSCDVNFVLRNNTHRRITGIIGVRGANLKKTKSINLNELSDITYVPFLLNDYEKKDYQGKILAKREPVNVFLTIIDKETIY